MTILKQETISALGWSASTRIGTQFVQFILFIILARLLTPSDFGLVAMVMVFTGFADLFSDLGFGPSIVQKKEIDDRLLSSIFWLNVGTGLVTTLIMFSVSPFISTFYNEPRLRPLVIIISSTFFLGSFGIVQRTLFQRMMDFRSLLIISLATNILSGIITIILVLNGFGFWSLAWHSLISCLVLVILTWQISPWKPSFSFDKKAVKEVTNFSGSILGFSIFNYWVRNGDNFLIGKFFNAAALGIYSRAYNIMLLPLHQISWVVGQVMFVSLSRIQDDKVFVKQVYLRTVRAIALITFPMMLGLFVVADSFVLTLLGNQWVDVILILRIFCIGGMIQSISTTVGLIFNSQGRADILFIWGSAAGVLLMSSFVVGILIGNIVALALCYTIMECVILLYPSFAIPGRLINLSFFEVVKSVTGVFMCALVMSVGVYLFGTLLPPGCSHWLQLLSKTSTGIILYFIFITLFKLEAYLDLQTLCREQWKLHHPAISQ